MRRILCLLVLILLFSPVVVFAQDDAVEPTNMEYLALFANAVIAGVGVQLVKWKLLPVIKDSAPYILPMLSMGIGLVSAYIMNAVGIDLTPIGDILGAGVSGGALASAGFAILKEVDNKRKVA